MKRTYMKKEQKKDRKTEGEKNTFSKFIKNYYFDSETFFQSVVTGDGPFYLFCGDLQKNMFFISENLKNEFGFSDCFVSDFCTLMGQRLCQMDWERCREEMKTVFEEKKTSHSLRCRIYNKDGKLLWVYCSGKMKWDSENTTPLFISGSLLLLERDADRDPLTGMKCLPGALERICARKKEYMILCFSLNNFYEINHLYGRSTGDKILQEAGKELQEEFGEDFQFIRMHGIRFMAVSESVLDPAAVVQRIQQSVGEIYKRHGVNIIYPCSVGVLRIPRDGEDVGTLTENASVIIRIAKEKMERRYVDFNFELEGILQRRSGLLLALNDSINHQFEGFRIVMQPQVEAKSGRVFGGEILLRWRFAGEDIPPDQFISILEFSGLIIPVGKWIIHQIALACKRILEIRPDFLISFNVSCYQIIDDSLIEFLKKEMQNYRIKAHNLIIELTEPHSERIPVQLEAFMEKCQELGIKVALDDFGTAYSSLHLLLKSPVAMIKLDRSLMKEITFCEEKKNFIMSIVDACHNFAKRICIEGVETKEELDIVLQTDCDYIQGFYFYKPVELDEVCWILTNNG